MHRSPRLFHLMCSIRFSAIVGPLRPLAIGRIRAARRSSPLAVTDRTIFPELDTAAAARRLDRDGFSPGLKLPEEQIQRIRDDLERSGASRRIDPHRDWASVAAVARDPKLVELARSYLGAEPILFGSVLWWSTPMAPTDHQYRFHFDVADFQSLTAFFYLTDVEIDSGAHCIIRGTHRPKSLGQCLKIYLTDSEAERAYAGRIEVITGPKGTGFVEELTAFHKVLPATARSRLMLGITFTLSRAPKGGDSNPLELDRVIPPVAVGSGR